MRTKLLVVDDEANIASTLRQVLEDEGYEVLTAARGRQALEVAETEAPALVLLDIMLPDISGLEVLERLKAARPATEVVVISGHATVDRTVDAIRLGAYDFLEKPLALKRVLVTVARALERRALALDRDSRQSADAERFRIVGESDATKRVRELIEQAAPTGARVLITGETGTGKELVAYWLHHLSPRRAGPYVKMNCAAIPAELIESELFGHEQGAFTGAVARRDGRLRAADNGTLLLDEIGDMAPRLQAKLLRVLETGEFEPVGSNKPQRADVRVLAATNKDLAREIDRETFRADLYHRLNVFAIHIPPLRERVDDIAILARHFLDAYCRENGASPKRLTPDAVDYLRQQPLPGNARELRNLIERAAIVAPGYDISGAVIARNTAPARTGGEELFTRTRALADARDDLERKYLETQLARFGWNITRAAAELDTERSSLSRRMKQLGIIKPEPYA